MPITAEMQRLEKKWASDVGWAKRLDWIEVQGLRGWTGQRFELRFPIMAVVGENGVGKSTILQAAASVYQPPREGGRKWFASDFFPDTPWEKIRRAEIRFSGRAGTQSFEGKLHKPTTRWRGNPERRRRWVQMIDLSRIQPVLARVGYSRIVKGKYRETSAISFEQAKLTQLRQILNRPYQGARMATTDADTFRKTPVINLQDNEISGFHQGAGETTIMEILEILSGTLPETALVLIDEIETSLHPRAQRRLVKYLAKLCMEKDLQVILTTHSPYILDEIPIQARACVIETLGGRSIVYGVSPNFAMTRMDDVRHHDCDLYVEDKNAQVLLSEILEAHSPGLTQRCRIIDYGAASVGKSLGQMLIDKKFPTPSRVFVDGDQPEAKGCIRLPGEDGPEKLVFTGLMEKGWIGLAERTGRDFGTLAEECTKAMSLGDPHEWIRQAASRIPLTPSILWQAMCALWAKTCLEREEAMSIVQAVQDAIDGVNGENPPSPGKVSHGTLIPSPRQGAQPVHPSGSSSNVRQPPVSLSLFDDLQTD